MSSPATASCNPASESAFRVRRGRRLASIYSGQTGFDIYTRAASDVYQDLYGEGIFVGKGIYEVETLHRVLDRRFPRNALLSHDLVEGAYARAGLVSDIEVIEDYPSHYSAHNRRKHRWMRGDWQIAGWLRPLVPEESGQRVPNPLSVVSRWKILDNLRRSLVEPALFLLLLLGWLVLPGGRRPGRSQPLPFCSCPQFASWGSTLAQCRDTEETARSSVDAVNAFLNASVAVWLTVTFLAHQALLSMDAVVRTMVRRMITRQRLLQWETAAQAELAGYKRTRARHLPELDPRSRAGIISLVWLVRPAPCWRRCLFFCCGLAANRSRLAEPAPSSSTQASCRSAIVGCCVFPRFAPGDTSLSSARKNTTG